MSEDRKNQSKVPVPTGIMQFENGTLNKEQLDSLLNTLPVEITFVDENDTVRYFNKPEKIIFVRTKAIIGRKVQNCHPAKSLDTVIKIVESFKSGKKNFVEFWIEMSNRKVHIRFCRKRSSGQIFGNNGSRSGYHRYSEASERETAVGLASLK